MSLKASGLCGVSSPAVAAAGILLAVSSAPWFSWTENSLSDLAGRSSETPTWAARGTPSILFNSSLVALGILTLVFAAGLGKSLWPLGTVGRSGTLAFVLGACALCAAGIFPRTFGGLHDLFSLSFFLLLPVSMVLVGAAMLKSSSKA